MSEQIDSVDSVATVLREGRTFLDRHPDIANGPAATLGGLTWGILRAVMECDNCPGVYRVPVSGYPGGVDAITCPSCGGVWVHRGHPLFALPATPETIKRSRKRTRGIA
jgi:hypothetical protein